MWICVHNAAADGRQSPSVSIRIQSQDHEFRVGQAFFVSVEIKNTGKESLDVFEPQILQTLEAQLVSGKSILGPQLIVDAPAPPKLRLGIGKLLQKTFDLTSLFPLPVQPGNYQLRVHYQYSENIHQRVTSNSIAVRVLPLSDKEKEASKIFLRIWPVNEQETGVEAAKSFLERYPDTAFSNPVRTSMAFALIKMGKQEEAIGLFNQVLASDEKRDWVKQEAQNYLWQAYADKGDTAGAIAVLEKFGGPQAKSNIAHVKDLNGKRIFEPPPPPVPYIDKPPTESINQMDYQKVLSSEADLKMTGLLEQWMISIKGKRTSMDYSNLFANEPFQNIQREGANGVRFVVAKVENQENLGDLPNNDYGANYIMQAISRTRLHFVSVATPENPKIKVFRCEEFPKMEVGRYYGQVRELWLKWWAEKDAKIPVWFRGRYTMWKSAKKSGDKSKADGLFRRVVDLGIFSLPLWMGKLNSDPQEAKATIGAISELTSGEVKADAAPAQVKAYWKRNGAKWTQVSEPNTKAVPVP